MISQILIHFRLQDNKRQRFVTKKIYDSKLYHVVNSRNMEFLESFDNMISTEKKIELLREYRILPDVKIDKVVEFVVETLLSEETIHFIKENKSWQYYASGNIRVDKKKSEELRKEQENDLPF